MSPIRFFICCVLVARASHCLASDSAVTFSRPVVFPASAEEELLAVALDSDVYAGTAGQLSNVRLLDAEGRSIAYLLRKVQTIRSAKVETDWTAKKLEGQPREDGGLEIIVRLEKDDPQVTGLTLITQLKDFEQRVRVYSSSEEDQWEPAGEETLIFDYSRFLDVRQTTVRFPKTGDRNFRIVVDNVTAVQESELLELTRRLRGADETEREEQVTIQRRPFRIDRIDFLSDFLRQQSAGNKKVDYPIGNMRIEKNTDDQQTIIHLESNRDPLTSFRLQTPDKNFSRRVTVEVPHQQGVRTSWHNIGESILSRIDFKGFKQEDLLVEFSESRHDSYRLVIHDRDSPSIEVTGVEAMGNVYELLFLASPETDYQLVYGNDEDSRLPQYDTAAIEQLLAKGFQPKQAQLGSQGQETSSPAAFRWLDVFNNRIVLFSAIGLLMVVLVWCLYQAAKRVDNFPNE